MAGDCLLAVLVILAAAMEINLRQGTRWAAIVTLDSIPGTAGYTVSQA